jgi:SHS2 domain-containing protein
MMLIYNKVDGSLPKKREFEFLEHTADVYVAACGRSLEEAFESAALATFEAMTDTDKIAQVVEEIVEVEGFDEKALLYNWLETLLVRFEISENLYSKFRITSLTKTDEGYKLKAKIYGEKFNSEKHPSKVGIKAVTYHQMEITKEPKKVTVKFILDV